MTTLVSWSDCFTSQIPRTALMATLLNNNNIRTTGISNNNHNNDHHRCSSSSPSSSILRLISRTTTLHSRRRLVIRAAAETNSNEVKFQTKDKVEVPPPTSTKVSSFNQLLGIRGAAQERDKWKIHLQLMKPVTWPPLVWGVVCGAAASGNFHWNFEDVVVSIACMTMSGPLLTGYTQTMNDWYDREIDAINEPYRPIPSGVISESEVIYQIWLLLLGGLGLAGLLDVWAGHTFPVVFSLALGGSLLSYLYSAPPLKFGIGIVNDFKSIEGDTKLGLQSIPVIFGIDTAKWICIGAINITQTTIAG
ncbi:Chlorophyll synthase protein [Thalictrum thalictroides]|uniref:Chlorophyll synthase protein n=1 Tax=Thalictrum thalictroides TaxID=46969 RepID=A0A7J6V5J2_THATH|nr:Chlorophyll synthase protein [Thalictrum thalictroides]